MVPTSAMYKSAIKGRAREWKLDMKITLDSGRVFDLTEDDIVLDSCTFTESAFCSDDIQVGGTYGNSLDFTLLNRDGKFQNENFMYARVNCRFGLLVENENGDGEHFEYVPMGLFNVIESEAKLTTISIKAMDDMYRLNKYIDTLGVLPLELPAALSVIASHCNIVLSSGLSEEAGQIDCDLSQLPTDGMTCRDFIGYVGALMGKNMRFSRDGALESFWFGADTYVTTPDSRLPGFACDDLSIQVTSVTIEDRMENTYTMPDYVENDNYSVTLDSNPLITTMEQASSALAVIYSNLSQTGYRAYECPYMGDPSVQVGDRVIHTFSTSDEPTASIISKHVLNFGGFGTLYAEGEPAEVNRQTTDTLRKISEVRKAAAKDLNDSIVGINQDLAHQAELVTSSMGFYVDYDLDESTGAFTRFWMMDAPTPETASIIWRFSADGAQVSHDHGNTFTSGWSADDTIIAHVISADMLKTGVLRSQDNTMQIDLGNGNFTAQTQSGSSQIYGHTISIYCKQSADGPNVSLLQVTSDKTSDDNAVDMQISFSSLDHESTVRSYIRQKFYLDEETGEISNVEPLTISSKLPVFVDSRLEVSDAIVYDNIIMQRKSAETGNTGVDFVYIGG